MIPRCPLDRGNRVATNLFGEVRHGIVVSAHEWIDKRTGEHRRRRIVMLDEEVAGGKRWNFPLEDLTSL